MATHGRRNPKMNKNFLGDFPFFLKKYTFIAKTFTLPEYIHIRMWKDAKTCVHLITYFYQECLKNELSKIGEFLDKGRCYTLYIHVSFFWLTWELYRRMLPYRGRGFPKPLAEEEGSFQMKKSTLPRSWGGCWFCCRCNCNGHGRWLIHI